MDYHPQKSERVRVLRKKLKKPEWGGNHIIFNPADKRGVRCVENASPYLRVRECSRHYNGATGWYVDSFYQDTTEARTVQLPGRDGTPQFFGAFTDPWNSNCYYVDFGDCHETKEEAERAAWNLAEHFAEECREDNAKQTAEMLIEQARETITRARADHSALAAEMRTARGRRQTDLFEVTTPPAPESPAICAALRLRLRQLQTEVREAREEIKKLTENYWEAIS